MWARSVQPFWRLLDTNKQTDKQTDKPNLYIDDIIKLQILRYQSREFHKFFLGINCCSYNTHGFHEIFAFRIFAKFSHFAFRENIFAKFSHFREISLCFRFIFFGKKCEISQKSLQKANENLWFFRETFRSLETLDWMDWSILGKCKILKRR